MNAIDLKAREYEFTSGDFERVRTLIYEIAGISLSSSKQDMVYSRLARRLRDRGLTRFADYLRLLESNDAEEMQAFTKALTTNLTAFFREAHHFPILADHIAERRRASPEPITIWCCAASTGEEPYTIAMTAIEALNDPSPPVRILATDVDTNVLAKAEAGIYDQERIDALSPERIRRFFLRGTGQRDGLVMVRPELRRLITFQQINLLDNQWPVRGPLDVIMCRNVMIYFDKDTQRQILIKFAPVMRSDGLLFAGHSESFVHSSDLFKLKGKTVYSPLPLARTGAYRTTTGSN